MSRSDGAYHHGHLAPALEAAALELLDRSSHPAVSLREVARLAGVSHNAPYHHFGDRTALLKRLAELCMAELVDAVRATSEGAANPIARVQAIGVAYVEYARAFPHRFAVIFDPEVCMPGEPSAGMTPLIDDIETMLDSAVRSLHPRSSPDEVAAESAAVWACAHGLATLVIAGHIPAGMVAPVLAVASRA